jgi:hypothetical protein
VLAKRKIPKVVGDWRQALAKHPERARPMAQSLIVRRLEMVPRRNEEGEEFYEFLGTGTLEPVVGKIPHEMASPTGTDDVYTIRLARWTPWKRAA